MFHCHLKYLVVRAAVVLVLLASVAAGQVTDLRTRLSRVSSLDLSSEKLILAKFTDQSELFALGRNRQPKEWTLHKGTRTPTFLPCGGEIYSGGLLDRSGDRFAVGCEDFTVEVWDLNSGRISVRFPTNRNKTSKGYIVPYLSPDGTRVVVELAEHALLWDTSSNKMIAELSSASSACYCNRTIYAIEFSPDGSVVAVAFGGMVFLWNTATGDPVSRLIDEDVDDRREFADRGTVRNIVFTSDSKTVITGSGVGTAKSWEVETGRLLRTFKGHKLAVTALALSSDDKILATGSRNQDVKLWDMETGKLIFSLDNRKEVRRISFRPDGARLMSMTSTHVFVWAVKTGSLLEEMPIPDILHTSLSPNWKYFVMPDKKKQTLTLYEYKGS